MTGAQLTHEPSPAPDDMTGIVDPVPRRTGDADHDGLLDDEEATLAWRFAPLVVLDGRDENRPASLQWMLSAVPPTGLTHSLGLDPPRDVREWLPLFDMPESVRRGAPTARDWATYVHAFPSTEGGVHIQYWFFYPYNDGPSIFDHEADWEHFTVRLDAARQPIGAYLAQHEHDSPGRSRDWSTLKKRGDHAVIYSALGSHATYGDAREVPWFDRIASCEDIDRCSDPMWRTWEGELTNVGERHRPLAFSEVLSYPGRWGKIGTLPGTSAPPGPLHHRGFCVGALPRCNEADSAISTKRLTRSTTSASLTGEP